MAKPGQLNPQQERFVREYLTDFNATQAAIRAGYSENSAAVQAARLLTNDKIIEAVDQGKAAQAEKFNVSAEWIIEQWAEIARADPHDLAQFRRCACKKCWDGQAPQREANPECTTCWGEGSGRVFIPDTRELTPAQRRLYAGVQQGKDGLRVILRDRDKALENLARTLGMFKDNLEVKVIDIGSVLDKARKRATGAE